MSTSSRCSTCAQATTVVTAIQGSRLHRPQTMYCTSAT
jgi:hypothetical protein